MRLDASRRRVSRAISEGFEGDGIAFYRIISQGILTVDCDAKNSCSCLTEKLKMIQQASGSAIIRTSATLCPRSMTVVQLICNHPVVVRFRVGAPKNQILRPVIRPAFLLSGLHVATM